MKLNLGCGRNIKTGWVNVDLSALPGVDIVADFERCREVPLPLPDDGADEMLLSHVIEHIRDTLSLMQELHRVARPGCELTIRCPYGSSDDAWEDQTHVRAYFPKSFGFFSQPYYWRADYGYRGDWRTDRIVLAVHPRFAGRPLDEINAALVAERNVVTEMVATLRAVKPIRAPLAALHVEPEILFAHAG